MKVSGFMVRVRETVVKEYPIRINFLSIYLYKLSINLLLPFNFWFIKNIKCSNLVWKLEARELLNNNNYNIIILLMVISNYFCVINTSFYPYINIILSILWYLRVFNNQSIINKNPQKFPAKTAKNSEFWCFGAQLFFY